MTAFTRCLLQCRATRLRDLICAVTFLLGSVSLFGQDAPESTELIREPAPLTAADIEQRSDTVLSTFADARRAIDEDQFGDEVYDQTLDEFEAALTVTTDSIEEDLQKIDLLVFDRIRESLENQKAQVEDWNAKLRKYTSQLAELRSTLRTDAEFFANAVLSEQAKDVPTALAEKIVTVRRDIEKMRAELAEKLNQSVLLRSRVVEFETAIEAALTKLESAARARRGRIVGLRGAPLFAALQEPWQSPVEAFSENRKVMADAWTEFRTRNEADVMVFAVMLLLLMVLIWYLRAFLKADAVSSISDRGRKLLVGRPLATAILVGLGLIPGALALIVPWPLTDVLTVIMILAAIRLLPMVMRPSLIRPVRGLLLLMFVNVLGSIVFPTGPMQRAIVFGTTIVAIVVLRQFLRRATNLPIESRPRFTGFMVGLTKVSMAALVAAVIADIFGAVSLSVQLSFGVLISSVVIAIVLAIDLALRTAWEILLASRYIQRLNALRHYPSLVRRRGIFIIRLILIAFLIEIMPELFPVVAAIVDSITDVVVQEWTFGNIQLSIETLLALTIGLMVAIYVSRLIRFVVDEDVVPRLPVDPGAGAAASRLIYYVLVLVGIALALASAGLEFGQVALIIGALGVGIGFGLQNIVNDFVSGIVVAFERPFKVGDTIEVGQLWGRVRHIGLRASTIRTFEGAEIIVPNASLISGQVINWTLSDRRRRIDIPVGVSYGSDPEHVQKILVAAVTGHPACLDNPEPAALFREFGESSLNFELRFWTPDAEQRLQTVSEVAISINEALRKAGITIPYPQRDLHVRTVTDKGVSIE